MATQSKGDEEPRLRKDTAPVGQQDFPPDVGKPSPTTGELLRQHANADGDELPIEPSKGEIQEGARDQIAFYEDTMGKKFDVAGVDEATARVLHQLHEDRQGWNKTMETDARAALQLLHPDVGGSRVHGPL